MPEFEVRWAIDVSAEDALEAAQKARATYFLLKHGSDVFSVVDKAEPLMARVQFVDLTDPENNRIDHDLSPAMLHRMARLHVAQGATTEDVLDLLEKPHKWPELLIQAILDEQFEQVATGPERADLSDDA